MARTTPAERVKFVSTYWRRGIVEGRFDNVSVGQACQDCGLREYGRENRYYRVAPLSYDPNRTAAHTAWRQTLDALPWRFSLDTLQDIYNAVDGAYEGRTKASLAIGADAIMDAGDAATVIRLRTVDDIVQAIIRGLGPVPVGGTWREEFEDVDAVSGRMASGGGNELGGHAVTISGADRARAAVRIVNDRGPSWGQTGRAWMSFTALGYMLGRTGEAYVIVPLRGSTANSKPEPKFSLFRSSPDEEIEV